MGVWVKWRAHTYDLRPGDWSWCPKCHCYQITRTLCIGITCMGSSCCGSLKNAHWKAECVGHGSQWVKADIKHATLFISTCSRPGSSDTVRYIRYRCCHVPLVLRKLPFMSPAYVLSLSFSLLQRLAPHMYCPDARDLHYLNLCKNISEDLLHLGTKTTLLGLGNVQWCVVNCSCI